MRSFCASARCIGTRTSMPPRCFSPRCNCAQIRESSSPGRFRAWRDTWNRSPPDWWQAWGRPLWPQQARCASFRGRLPWDRCAPTSRAPTRPSTNPRTSRSTCCRSSRIRRAIANSGTRKCAAARWPRSNNISVAMPDAPRSALEAAIERYLADLRLHNESAHTLRNYASDLEQFAGYFSPKEQQAPAPTEFTVLHFREWLGDLYRRRLSPVSVRRKLAAVRSLFQFLAKQGAVPSNIARLVKTPKAPQRLPVVPTAEQTNDLINAVAEDRLERPFPERDRLIFELLYG